MVHFIHAVNQPRKAIAADGIQAERPGGRIGPAHVLVVGRPFAGPQIAAKPNPGRLEIVVRVDRDAAHILSPG